MNNYRILKLDSSNLKHLYVLFKAVYHKTCHENYFELKYNTNYTGKEFIGYLAFNENDTAIAYYGVLPTLVSINKHVVLAAQSCDTMTHPDYRHKGLFVTLAKQTFELAKNNGIHFVFGFPNQNSYPGFIQKLGFIHTETMNRYSIQFQNTPYKVLYRKLKLIMFRKKADAIPNSLIEEGYDGVIYSQNYIDHKKNYGQNLIIKENNTSFWVNARNSSWIGALHLSEKELTLQTVKKLESLTNASSITFMVSAKNQLDEALSKIVKPEKGFAVITKNLSEKYNLNNLKFQFSDIDVF